MEADSTFSPGRISVALCTCNGEKFLHEQLATIQSQSKAVDEIIISDDCSDDTTAEIVLAFAAETSVEVKWFRNAERLGVTRNFEKAISLCTGEFIFLCDQDDIWQKDKVAGLVEELSKSPAAVVFSNAQVVGEDLKPLGYRLWESIWFDAKEQERMKSGDALPVLLRHAVAAGATMAFRSEYRPLILPIPDLPHSHDIWIALLLSCVASITPVDRDLIQYRLHGDNHVGMQKYGIKDQVRLAKKQIENGTFSYLRELHQHALDRLTAQSGWRIKPKVTTLLQEKIDHSKVRHEMPKKWMLRCGTVITELWHGNYAKYSYGHKSVLQDLFLR